jgi:predicted membrane protein
MDNKNIIIGVGMMLWWGSLILLSIFWVIEMTKWLGAAGTILAILGVIPGTPLLPFIYWMIEKTFPDFYFAILGIGIFGLILVGVSSKS